MNSRFWHCRMFAAALFVLTTATTAMTAMTATAGDDRLSFTFRQEGYSEGAFVTGAFSGFDLDDNGILVQFLNDLGGPPFESRELTSFSMTFSGNSLAPAFRLGIDDLFGFVFEIDSGDLGDDPAFVPALGRNLIEGIGAIGENSFYTSGEGPNQFIGGFIGGAVEIGGPDVLAAAALDSTQEIVNVARVPEPATAMLLVIASVAACLRHRPMA